jgi:hypothetical protein
MVLSPCPCLLSPGFHCSWFPEYHQGITFVFLPAVVMKNLFLLLVFLICLPFISAAKEIAPSLDPQALAVIYSGQETMHFSISWSGGIKIGDLYMTLAPSSSGDGLALTARVTDYGLFKFFYPGNDTFTTFVRGPLKLPYRYEVHQLEGSDMDVRRQTLYDQQNLSVQYRKNNNPQLTYTMEGPSYNEFSSFFITRALQLSLERQEIVPTFVDAQRYKVAVHVLAVEARDSIFGRVDTFKVMPKMSFKGLYEKDGDTIFWLTNDTCRVPVTIESKILIGSLVAELVEYKNPACPLHIKKR